ncbi:MAG: hypothetical protein KDA41_12255, partial [Planctomycetales bacterium]|nr:hypothetical protein [Planctomycetales bacterium]
PSATTASSELTQPQAAPAPQQPIAQQPIAQPAPQGYYPGYYPGYAMAPPAPYYYVQQPQQSQQPRAHAPSSLPGSPAQAPQPRGIRPAMLLAAPIAAPIQLVQGMQSQPQAMQPSPQFIQGTGGGVMPARYDHPNMPGYAWPSYASSPNYAALQYPKQYSAHAWPYIGPFYPYPQVPLGWRKVTLSWDDGWWSLDFKDRGYGPYVTR